MTPDSSYAEIARLQYLQYLGIGSYYPRFVLPGAAPSQPCPWPEELHAGIGRQAQSGESHPGQAGPSSPDVQSRHERQSRFEEHPPQLSRHEGQSPFDGYPQHEEHPRYEGESPGAAEPGRDAQFRQGREAGASAAEAAAPRRMVWPDENTAAHADRETRTLIGTTAVVPGPESAGQAAVSPAGDRDAAAPPQLHLVFVKSGERLALLCQLPLLARPGLAPRQRQLLDNILHWLGTGAVGDELRVFRWPLPGFESVPSDQRSAGLGLTRFLEQAAIELPFRELVLFGMPAAECLGTAFEPGAADRPWQLTTTHSLDELLAQPLLKRETWQALLPLHARLRQA